jgi:hypothetical protein
MATSAREFNTARASLPVVAVRTSMPRRSSTLLSAKILRVSSSTKSTVRFIKSSSELCRRRGMLVSPAADPPRP